MAKRQQRVTLEDVARRVGVSTMTISRVINNTGRVSEATRQQVLAAIDALDYRPSRAARSLASHKTSLLGVVVADITNPFFAEIVRGIQGVAWKNDYSVLLADFNEAPAQERAVLDRMDPSLTDGLIICSSRLSSEELQGHVARQNAVALINTLWPDMPRDLVVVHSNQKRRSQLAAEHLLRSGRCRIGYVELQHRAAVNIPIFLETMAQACVPVDDTWYAVAAPTWQGGYDGAQQLLAAHPDLDAVICGNDMMALGVMRAVRDVGRRVPQDVAITGGDDTSLASQVTPPLTSFRVDSFGMGQMAASLLFERLAGRDDFDPVPFEEEIVVRASAP